jgi:hypothetical protein
MNEWVSQQHQRQLPPPPPQQQQQTTADYRRRYSNGQVQVFGVIASPAVHLRRHSIVKSKRDGKKTIPDNAGS